MSTSLNKYLDPAALDETVVNIRELVEGLEEEMQDLPYARPDGIYPDMTVGAVIGADTTAQWATRESTGSGAATVRSVQGAAIGYNQYQIDSYTVSMYGLTVAVNDGLLTVTGVPESTRRVSYALTSGTGLKIPSGHTLLMYNTNNTLAMYVQGLAAYTNYGHRFLTANDSTYGKLAISMDVVEGQPVDISAHVMLFDLTAMFGSGSEPTTVAEFERMFPASYYPYSAPTLKPVQIAGIRSTDAQGGELDAIEWPTQTLRAAGSVADELTSNELVTRVGVLNMGTVTWTKGNATNDGTGVIFHRPKPTDASVSNHISCAAFTPTSVKNPWEFATLGDIFMSATGLIVVADPSYTTAAAFQAAMQGVYLFYELATPTTTPISPALPMTYKVQAGGSESIIVPAGEASAAPVLTVAEPVNAGDEFARIWAAIQSLGYTRNTAQLSRPVSLTDIGSIDKVQKDTTDVAEIETIKEVTE